MSLRSSSVPRPARARSSVSNGNALFVEGSGRSAFGRRFRDLVELHLDDLGSRESLSASQMSLVRRVAAMEVWCEQQEGLMSQGKDVDMDMFSRVQGHLRRTAETLGVKRAIRTIDNPLVDHFSRPPERVTT